jgi:hypothetical protein
VPYLPNAPVYFSPGDIQDMHELEVAYNGWAAEFKKRSVSIINNLRHLFSKEGITRLFTESQSEMVFQDRQRHDLETLEQRYEEKKQAKEDAKAANEYRERMEAIKYAEEEQKKLEEQEEAENRLERLRRQHMGRGRRRQSIQEEYQRISEKLEAEEFDFKNGMARATPEQQKHINQLKEQQQELLNELHEKPLGLSADNLAKIGGFTGGSLALNPMLPVSQAQLRTLERIYWVLANHPDPWRR